MLLFKGQVSLSAHLQSHRLVLRCRESPQRFLFSLSVPQQEASGERREEDGDAPSII